MATLAPSALACSGPGAARAMTNNMLAGWVLLAVAAGVAATVLVLTRSPKPPWSARWLPAVLAAIHPGWWMSVRSGDCGFMLRNTSIAMTAIVTAVGCAIYLLARRKAASAQLKHR